MCISNKITVKETNVRQINTRNLKTNPFSTRRLGADTGLQTDRQTDGRTDRHASLSFTLQNFLKQ
jgi:hypothetical protein